MSREYIDFKYTFQELKDKIDLVDFFLTQNPNYKYEKKKRGYTLRNTSGDLIDLVIFFNDKGTQKYLNLLDEHGGDLLSFIKNTDIIKNDGTDKDYYFKLNVFLHNYINQDIQTIKKEIPKDIYNKPSVFFNYFEITENLSDINDDKNKAFITDYLNYRQINLETLNNKVFKDKLFVLKQKNETKTKEYTYISSKIQSIINGTPVGLTRKNKSFNGIERNSARGKGFFISNYNNTKPIKELFIFEAWEDALAYFELKNLNEEDNNVFVATNGNYSEIQKNDLTYFIEKNNIKKVNLCNDNDVIGNLYNLSMLCKLSENLLIDFSKIKTKVSASNPIDTAILIKAVISIKDVNIIDKSSFIKLTGDVFTNYNKQEIKLYKKHIAPNDDIKGLNLENELIVIRQSKNKKDFTFFIPYKEKSISLFNKYIIKTDNAKQKKIIINKPINNDFNNDLIIKKNRLNAKKKLPRL